MKRKLARIVLLVFLFAAVFCTMLSVRAVTTYGDHIFDADRMMQFDEGTRFENGIVNGGVINPGTGEYSTYMGIKFDTVIYKGEKAVKVELLDNYLEGYFDFNYYQHNATAEKPVLDAKRYPYLKIRYAYSNTDVEKMTFWAAKKSALGTGGSTTKGWWSITNGDGEWRETIVNLSNMRFADNTLWSENDVRQFRIYMFDENANSDAVCYVSGFGFFETKEMAEAYDFSLAEGFSKIIYDANGGVGAPKATLKQDGGKITLSTSKPGRLGYKFIGWSTVKGGSVVYEPGDEYSANKDLILYAVWGADPDAKEGDHIFDADRMLEFEPGTRFHNGIVNGAVINPALGTYSTYQGVEFAKTTRKGEPAIKVELLDGYVNGFLDFNYYRYDAKEYEPTLNAEKYPYFKIRYAYEGASDVYQISLLFSKATSVLGGTTAKETSVRVPNGYGEWKEAVIDLRTLEFPDGTSWSENTIRQFRINLFNGNRNPEAVCYVAGFGFFETEEQAKTYDFETDEYGYLVEYSANGGVCAPMTQIKEKNQSINIASGIPAKRGYKFMGWSTSIDGEVEYQPGDVYTESRRVKFYAVWEKETSGELTMGEHIFEGDRLVEFEEGTDFHNGFANGAVINPVTGLCPTYAGVSLEMTAYKNEKAMKVDLLGSYYTDIAFLDFNYYQWDADKYEPSLDAAKYPYIRIRYAYKNADGVDSMTLWASKDSPILGTVIKEGTKDFDITADGEWNDVVFDLSSLKFGDNTYWDENTIRQFRILPFKGNTNPDAELYIAGFGFFETEEQAKNYKFDTALVMGDADGDGEVNSVDVICLARQLARWSGYKSTETTNYTLDLNKDGSVNTLDLIYLSRYIAGWTGYDIPE